MQKNQNGYPLIQIRNQKHRLLKQTHQHQNNIPNMIPKRMNRTRTHWSKAPKGFLVDQLAKHGWKWPRDKEGRNAKLTQTRVGTNYD